jgi:hypothetical protein
MHRRQFIFSTIGLTRLNLACAIGSAISSRRCSGPSSTLLSPARAMHGGRQRMKVVVAVAAFPAIGTAVEHGR